MWKIWTGQVCHGGGGVVGEILIDGFVTLSPDKVLSRVIITRFGHFTDVCPALCPCFLHACIFPITNIDLPLL